MEDLQTLLEVLADSGFIVAIRKTPRGGYRVHATSAKQSLTASSRGADVLTAVRSVSDLIAKRAGI